MSEKPEEPGHGWLFPLEPGVPANSHLTHWHWVAWPSTGWPMAIEWDADNWMWQSTWLGNFVDPGAIAFMDYLGPITLPENPYFRRCKDK